MKKTSVLIYATVINPIASKFGDQIHFKKLKDNKNTVWNIISTFVCNMDN